MALFATNEVLNLPNHPDWLKNGSIYILLGVIYLKLIFKIKTLIMHDSLHSATSKEKNEEFTFLIQGDLCQIASQKRFLNSRGIQTEQNDVYPCVKESDIVKALTLIWSNRIDGWWHYKDRYIKHSICTEIEYIKLLKIS